MIFLRRFKKYIIMPKYRNSQFTKLIVNIDQIEHGPNTKIKVNTNSEFMVFLQLLRSYRHFLNQKPVKTLNLQPETLTDIMRSKYHIFIKKSLNWQSIYIFDQNPVYRNIQSIIIDHDKKIICVTRCD